MKKCVLSIFLFLIASSGYAQERSVCDSATIGTSVFIKTSDPCLPACVDYVLSHPLYGNPESYDRYMRFILVWMEKTADYTFTLNNKILNLCKDDNLSLFNIYLACLTKGAIEDKKPNTVTAVKLFTAYLKKPENKVKQTMKIKKLIRDVETGRLQNYL